VSKESATIDGYEQEALAGMHRNIQRWDSKEEEGYKAVVGRIKALLQVVSPHSSTFGDTDMYYFV